jgi:hypothetical protein
MTVVIVVSSAAHATAKSTTSSRIVILVVRHVTVVVSSPASCDRKCSPGTEAVTSPQIAVEIKHAVSVHQGSLIH